MKLVCSLNFSLNQKISIVDDSGKVVDCVECPMNQLEDRIVTLCNEYAVETVFLDGGRNFTNKIANDLSLMVNFNQNKTKIIAN